MIGWLGEVYPWVKAAHVVFVIFWMAGMFMLPRYLVYHQEAHERSGPGSPEAARWVEREDMLRRIILTPSMFAVWGLGLALAANLGMFDGQPGLGWLHAKFAIVALLTAYHGWAVGYARKLQRGLPSLTGSQLRLINEAPALAAVAIVVLVVVRPF